MRLFRLIVYWGLLLLGIVPTLAQTDSCPQLVQTALSATDKACLSLGRNQACYGNVTLSAVPKAGVSDFKFTKPGDFVTIEGIQTLTLSPMDKQKDVWGVALLKLQANLPDTLPGQNLTFLLFGSVEIRDAVKDKDKENPLSAFYFKTGLNDALCTAAPDSGILVQTPKGASKITFTANDVQVELGSTAYLQAQPGGEMTISVVEGQATLTAQSVTVIAPAGTRVRVPLDANV